MRGQLSGIVVVLGLVALITGGCAHQDIVKKGESLTPKVSATEKTATKTDNAPAKSRTGEPQSVKQDSKKKDGTSQDINQLKAVLEKIYFELDSAKLSPEARQSLVKSAETLKQNPNVKIRIEGNCDERGSDEYNLALGEKRAKAAMDYFVTMGVPIERLSVVSYGKEKPAKSGHDETAWAQNRRDEFASIK